jgi:hypothetical protein
MTGAGELAPIADATTLPQTRLCAPAEAVDVEAKDWATKQLAQLAARKLRRKQRRPRRLHRMQAGVSFAYAIRASCVG